SAVMRVAVGLLVLVVAPGAGCRTRLPEPPDTPAVHLPSPQCRPPDAASLPDGAPCDDGDPCTAGDRCLDDACVGTPVAGGEGEGCLPWKVGWDRDDLVINLAASYVSWRHPTGSRDLTAHYHIVGAEPGSHHVVGIHSFDPEGRCLHRFGQFT